MFSVESVVNIYKLIWIFFIGSIIGYSVEMLWCYIRHGHFESRKGVIYGTISPVYGFGAVILTLLLYRFVEYDGLIIFFVSALIGGVFEYICSWIQEKTFGSVSWEYGSKALSIHGRTSVEYCFFWGILGIFFLKEIYPAFQNFIGLFSDRTVIISSIIFLIILVPDMIISGLAVKRKAERLKGVQANNKLDKLLDGKYTDEFLEKIYPNMVFK